MSTIKIMTTTPALRSITTTAMAASNRVATSRRCRLFFNTTGQRLRLSSTTKFPKGVGVIKPRNNKPSSPSPAFTQEVTGGDSAAESAASSDELPWNVKRNNYILASILFTFCTGVAWYSMNAVGQADTNRQQSSTGAVELKNDDNDSDPLAALRIEAQAAQKTRDKQQQDVKEASVMLQQFDKGEFDPDRIDDDDDDDHEQEDDAEKKQGKSWWRWLKFW